MSGTINLKEFDIALKEYIMVELDPEIVRTDRHFPFPHSFAHTKLKSPCGTGAQMLRAVR